MAYAKEHTPVLDKAADDPNRGKFRHQINYVSTECLRYFLCNRVWGFTEERVERPTRCLQPKGLLTRRV
jgi:hypothetical protein